MKGITKKHFDKTFSNKKRGHSKEVRDLTCKLGCSTDTEQAALFHDFIENGGTEKDLKKLINKNAFKLVQHLTKDDSDDVLNKLQQELKNANFKNKDKIIKIKLADRAVNYNRRKNPTENYTQKTAELVNYLLQHYSKPKKLFKFVKQHFLNHSALKRRIKFY